MSLIMFEMSGSARCSFNEPDLAVALQTAFDSDRIEISSVRHLDKRPRTIESDFAASLGKREITDIFIHSKRKPDDYSSVYGLRTTSN